MNKKQENARLKAWLKDVLEPAAMSMDEALSSTNPLYEISRRLRPFAQMSSAEKEFFMVYSFQFDSMNGGLHQCMTNSTGEFFETMAEFSARCGLSNVTQVLNEVRAMFPRGDVPTEREERVDAVCEMGEEIDPFEKLTTTFYEESDAITSALLEFVRNNRSSFQLRKGALSNEF